jgi:hypothetical protein
MLFIPRFVCNSVKLQCVRPSYLFTKSRQFYAIFNPTIALSVILVTYCSLMKHYKQTGVKLTVSTFGCIPSVWFILADVSGPSVGQYKPDAGDTPKSRNS